MACQVVHQVPHQAALQTLAPMSQVSHVEAATLRATVADLHPHLSVLKASRKLIEDFMSFSDRFHVQFRSFALPIQCISSAR